MNALLSTLDAATKSAAGKRLTLSLSTAVAGYALSKVGVPASLSTVITPDVASLISDVLMGIGAAGVAAFNAINHAKVVDQQSVDTPKP